MEKTAVRLELSAELVEQTAEKGADELKALYLLSQRELNEVAASSSQAPHESQAYATAQHEGRDMKTHYDTSLQIHRMTGGGRKMPLVGESGPVATALNPNRHVMMIHGRPVMVLSVKGTYKF